ncbi:manganese transport protein [Ensifer adhaerens]|nr:manganese transport protein [Ensifer adhaerens]HZG27781.1 Nramp family divalent metal transporter [Ensifer sp.]
MLRDEMQLESGSTIASRHEQAMRDALAGRRSGVRAFLPFFGPAVIASIAYMDPGNFATNIQAGAGYGYALLWVLLAANLIAMLFQSLSAKLGIVTGMNLAEMCREQYPKPMVYVMWVISEIAAMATDLAEFLGGAIGLSLIFGMPLLAGMVVTAIITYVILIMEQGGFRRMEILIGAFVAVISLCYLVEMLIAPVEWGSVAKGLVSPKIPDTNALMIAVGIVGATVMPHAVFLHSGLTQGRIRPADDRERRMLVRFSNREVVIALAAAGLVNMAMVIMAAAAFHLGHSEVAEIETAYHTLTPLLGGAAASFFLVSLIASGVSSSVVGTMAGQVIMQGFVGFRIPLLIRRLVTMVPAFAVVLMGVDSTKALVVSQVILSIALPIPMLALLHFTSRRSIMGHYVNPIPIRILGAVGSAVVLCLNFLLLAQVAGLF